MQDFNQVNTNLSKYALNLFLKLNFGDLQRLAGMLFHSLAPDLQKNLNCWFDLESLT